MKVKGDRKMQANIYRDMTMAQVSEDLVGKEIRLAGWVENIRDHGGVSFVDLRDMYGVMQVVMRDTTLLDGITKEQCISVAGLVQHRDEETYNPKIPTGTIELEAHEVDILGKVYKQLPFEVTKSEEEDHVFLVEGPRIEKMLGYTNLESEKGFAFFQRFLKDNGILKMLEDLGIEEGDTVRLYGLEFDYYR